MYANLPYYHNMTPEQRLQLVELACITDETPKVSRIKIFRLFIKMIFNVDSLFFAKALVDALGHKTHLGLAWTMANNSCQNYMSQPRKYTE